MTPFFRGPPPVLKPLPQPPQPPQPAKPSAQPAKLAPPPQTPTPPLQPPQPPVAQPPAPPPPQAPRRSRMRDWTTAEGLLQPTRSFCTTWDCMSGGSSRSSWAALSSRLHRDMNSSTSRGAAGPPSQPPAQPPANAAGSRARCGLRLRGRDDDEEMCAFIGKPALTRSMRVSSTADGLRQFDRSLETSMRCRCGSSSLRASPAELSTLFCRMYSATRLSRSSPPSPEGAAAGEPEAAMV
mmetsp:Transcript_51485/g.147006  ORF Transcript_51485/g.147006 Transcript_51485/m.147006 type:complete len:239 (+) Transcript_51485:978-1694(+)